MPPSKKKSSPPPRPLTPPPVVKAEEAWDRHVDSVLTELQGIYSERLEPMEQRYQYDVFKPSWFAETIKQKKPFVTFLGPFSSGKSTFINYLMQGNYLLTGPQPVTDKFRVIMYGDQVQEIPGRVLMADANQPFRALTQFGDSFAECFAGMTVPHPVLRSVSMIDTPGVLEAAGEVHARRYDYVKVCRWFVEKSDMVFVLFDPSKLDAGSELRMVFKYALRGFEGKIRIVLNKADSVRPQELMRVYGALFWSLSNMVDTTEPPRVYVSSFWDCPYKPDTDHALFEREKEDLLYELIETIPMQSLDRRVTAVIRRTGDVLIYILLCASYRSRIPSVFGKSKAKAGFYEQYPVIVKDLAARYHLSEHDFPSVKAIKDHLTKIDSHEFPDTEKLNKKGWVTLLKKTLDYDLPMLLQPVKEHAVIDPRDRKSAIMLQREYTKQMAHSYVGEDESLTMSGRGGYGGSTRSRSPPLQRAISAPLTPPPPHPLMTPSSSYGPTPQLLMSASASDCGAADVATQQQMLMMMQTMQAMMANQQQPSPSLSASQSSAQASASLSQQQQPQQMAAMMAMMQQMQQMQQTQ